MSTIRVASRYAKSLLDLAAQGGKIEKIKEDMSLFSSALESRDFALMLKSPIINGEKKRSIFKAIFGDKVDELTSAFFDLIVKKGREASLPEIATSFNKQYDELHGIVNVEVTAAANLTKETLSTIESKLKDLGINAEKVNLTTAIDPELIGGFVLRIDDRLYDASIKTKLANVRKRLQDNT